MKRIKFRCPYRVKPGAAVLNNMAKEVGLVIGVTDEAEEDEAGNPTFWIEADVLDEIMPDDCQVMQPTIPV